MEGFSDVFSNNLQRTRKAKGVSQKELADFLGYSEKTVSKWECGKLYPPLDVFVEICNFFKINSNVLLHRDDRLFFLGIDGGGTKTSFLLQDSNGNTVAETTLGSSNPCDIGIDNAKKVLKQGIEKICWNVSAEKIWAYAGIAGCLSGNYRPSLLSFLGTFGFAGYDCGSDNNNIISAGLHGQDGVTVIMGTGFCIYQIFNGICKQIGGWGYLLDEGGSGFNLGREALSAVYSAIDGTGDKTILTDLLDVETKDNRKNLMNHIYVEGKSAVASYTPIVMEAASKGDKIALDIIKRNVSVVAEKIRFSISPFAAKGETANVVLTGGLARDKVIYDELTCILKNVDHISISVLDKSPAAGAVELAQKLSKNEEIVGP